MVALAPQWEYYFNFTLDAEAGHTLADVISNASSGIGVAAVSNMGSDANWCVRVVFTCWWFSFFCYQLISLLLLRFYVRKVDVISTSSLL
mgnify:CR=1 FL=1